MEEAAENGKESSHSAHADGMNEMSELTMFYFNFRLHTFEDGKHNLHLRYADEFNNLVTEFLSE